MSSSANLVLGSSRRRAVELTDEERSRHLHIVGASGTGKSKLLEHLIRQDILARRGLCLIDPHGSLADALAAWLASRSLDRTRTIRVVNASDAAWSMGFNPLALTADTEPSVRVDAMVAACAQVWGGEDTNSTPRLKKSLRAVFYTLAVRGLTLAEAPLLTTLSNAQVRRTLTEGLPDQAAATTWADLNALGKREFAEIFESTNNRMGEFLASPLVRRMVGQARTTFDAGRAMSDGEIVIVNLQSGIALSPDNARLIGTLLTSEFRLRALERDVEHAARHPFTLYIDECQEFLTDDVARMLDQTRKFGLHLVLSHQRLGHLRERSPHIYNGVMTGGQTKIVFGGLSDEDAEIMAKEVFRSSLQLERPKHSLDKLVTYDEVPFWLDSYSATEGGQLTTTSSESTSWGTSDSTSESASERLTLDQEVLGLSRNAAAAEGSFESSGTSQSSAESASWSTTRGASQTLKPLRRIMATAVHSLEEELHLKIVKLRELPKQAAVLKSRGRAPVRFRPAEVAPPLVSPARVAAVVARVRDATPYVVSATAADAQLEERRRLATRTIPQGETGTGESEFWND